jgi:hypothetical protein
VGVAESVKSGVAGACTTSAAVAVWLNVPDVPVTVKTYDPVGVVVAVVTVRLKRDRGFISSLSCAC